MEADSLPFTVANSSQTKTEYAGHHAEILEERSSLVRVAIFPQGTPNRAGAEPNIMWIDLASPDQIDAGPQSLTEIGLGRSKQGALFLISTPLSPKS